MNRSKHLLVAVSVALALICGGCDGDDNKLTTSATPKAPTAESTNLSQPSSDWLIEPGRLGPIAIGLDGGEAKLKGFAEGNPSKSCDHRWVTTEQLTKNGIQLEFRDGKNADDLDHILVYAPDPDSEVGAIEHPAGPAMRTKEGVGIGTSFSKIRAIYGDNLLRGQYTMEGGDWIGYTVFGRGGGAITFDAGSVMQEESPTVTRIFVSGGTRDNFDPPVLGC